MNVSQDGPPSEPADKLGQNAPDDILINTYSERQIDLLGDMWTSPRSDCAVSSRQPRGSNPLLGVSVPACLSVLAKTTADIYAARARDEKSARPTA